MITTNHEHVIVQTGKTVSYYIFYVRWRATRQTKTHITSSKKRKIHNNNGQNSSSELFLFVIWRLHLFLSSHKYDISHRNFIRLEHAKCSFCYVNYTSFRYWYCGMPIDVCQPEKENSNSKKKTSFIPHTYEAGRLPNAKFLIPCHQSTS